MGKKQVWVFGGVSRLTGDMWVERIADKKRTTLYPIIQARIRPLTFIMSDEHRSYQGLKDRLRMKGHAAVNHSVTYVDGTTQVRGVAPRLGSSVRGDPTVRAVVIHTNTIERQCRKLKKALRTCRSKPRVPTYIVKFLYRRNVHCHIPTLGRQLGRFLEDIRRVYPGHQGYAQCVQRPH